jgi:hypothetical protein
MHYLVLLYADEAAELALDPAERRAIMERHLDYARGLRERGALVAGDPLGPSGETAVLRGGRHVSDGPFAETKEQLGGYYVIEAPSRDAAIELATGVPSSPGLVVEVRPLAEM